MALYTSSCCLWKKIEMCTLLACTPLTTPANECKKANLTFGSSNGTTERERERKRIHEYKSKNATTTNNYAKGIWLA